MVIGLQGRGVDPSREGDSAPPPVGEENKGKLRR